MNTLVINNFKSWLTVILCGLILSFNGNAFSSDSLKNALHNPELSKKALLKIQWRLAFKYTYIDPDSGLKWSKVAFEEATKQTNSRSIQGALHLMGVNYTKLLRYDSAKLTAQHKYNIGEQFNDSVGMIDAQIDLGNVNLELGEYDSAIHYYTFSLKKAYLIDSVSRPLARRRLIQRCLINLGEAAKDQGFYTKSLQYFRQAESRGLRGFYASVHRHYGELYTLQNDFDNAKSHFLKAIKSARINNRRGSLSNYYISFASMYEEYAQLDSALLYIRLANNILEENGNAYASSRLKIQYARLIRASRSPDSALKILQPAIKIMEARKMAKELPKAYLELAICHLLLDQHLKAKQNFLKSYETSKSMSTVVTQKTALEYLYKLAKSAGKLSLSQNYLEELRQIELKIYNKEQTRKLAQAQAEHEYEVLRKKEEALAAQRFEFANTQYEKELQSEKVKLRLMAIIGLIVLFASGLLLYAWMDNKKKNKLLIVQKEALEKRDAEKELLLREIHHRVKNNLQVISSLLDLQTMRSPSEQATKQLKEGQSRVKSMALIHQKLYQQENLSTVDFSEYLTSISSFIKSTFLTEGECHISINAQNCNLDIDRAIPLGLIANELLTNAFKYGKVADRPLMISIEMTENDSTFNFIVQDNGPGMSSDNEMLKPKSLGMRIVKRLTKQLNGTLEYSFDSGAKFELLF